MRKRDLVLLLVLSLAAAWRWSSVVSSQAVLPDENVYLNAARHLAAGHSPYDEPGYFYPPPIAFLIQALTPRFGEIGALKLLRMMALAGLTLTAWLALRSVSWPWWLTLPLAASYFLFSPAVEIATALGNAAGLASGLVLFGLLKWQQRPRMAGICLGMGLAIKPIAPVAPLLLALHRPDRPTRNHLIAAALSVIMAGGICLTYLRFLPGLLANAQGHSNAYNFSLHKLLADLGLAVPALLLLIVITAAAALALRRRELGATDLFAVIVTINLFALPILWAHSMLILLPLQLLALDSCVATWRLSGPFPSLRFRFFGVLAVAACAATLLPHAVGTTYGIPAWANPIARAVPLLAIPFIGWFVVTARTLEPNRGFET